MSEFDRIGAAELLPDLGVLVASLFLPKFFRKFSGSDGYQQVAKTLSEQFMPDKDGKGFNDEVLLAEVTMLLSPVAKTKFEQMLNKLTKGERKFFSGAIALFASKYQKERKQAQKNSEGKDVGQVSVSLDPLTADNPAIKFLEQNLLEENRSVEKTIEMLRDKRMIRESIAGKILMSLKSSQNEGSTSGEKVIAMIMRVIEEAAEMPKQKVGPLGLIIAFLLGRSDQVEFFVKRKPK